MSVRVQQVYDGNGNNTTIETGDGDNDGEYEVEEICVVPGGVYICGVSSTGGYGAIIPIGAEWEIDSDGSDRLGDWSSDFGR